VWLAAWDRAICSTKYTCAFEMPNSSASSRLEGPAAAKRTSCASRSLVLARRPRLNAPSFAAARLPASGVSRSRGRCRPPFDPDGGDARREGSRLSARLRSGVTAGG